MCEIILFDKEGCTGNREDFSIDTPDLGTKFFSGVARSLKVKGDHWLAYTGKDYTGECKIYGEGEHVKLGPFDQKISSLKPLNIDLSHPSIDVYEHVDFKGDSRNVEGRIDNLKRGGFDNLISSHIVKAGVWILYDGLNCQGRHMIALEGDKVKDYCALGWNDKISSLRPLLTSDKEV